MNINCNKVIVRDLANGRNVFISKCSSATIDGDSIYVKFTDGYKKHQLANERIYEVILLLNSKPVFDSNLKFGNYFVIVNQYGYQVNQLQFGVL